MTDAAALQFLPWHAQQAQDWLGRRDRFAHAWLIHGLAGTGKRQFARAGAASLLCETPQQGLACGQCTSCQWVVAGNHPDLRLIRPEALMQSEAAQVGTTTAEPAAKNPSREIRIEQLRALHDWFNMATHRGGWRVAVLYPAEALNRISANALLKLLEEPPEHTLFLLVADAPDRLLPTLLSRCRRLPLAMPQTEISLAWLQKQGLADPSDWLAAAGGAPLLALEQSVKHDSACPAWLGDLLACMASASAEDFARVADKLEKQPVAEWVDVLQRFFTDLLLAASHAPIRYYPALENQLLPLAQGASPVVLSEAARWLVQQKALAGHPLNVRLLAHTALQRVMLACAPVAA